MNPDTWPVQYTAWVVLIVKDWLLTAFREKEWGERGENALEIINYIIAADYNESLMHVSVLCSAFGCYNKDI